MKTEHSLNDRVLLYFHEKTEAGGPQHFLGQPKEYANKLGVDEYDFRLALRTLAMDGFIDKAFLEGKDEITLTEKGRGGAKKLSQKLQLSWYQKINWSNQWIVTIIGGVIVAIVGGFILVVFVYPFFE
jgi:DNA-binding MarR family transcriptional regulator